MPIVARGVVVLIGLATIWIGRQAAGVRKQLFVVLAALVFRLLTDGDDDG